MKPHRGVLILVFGILSLVFCSPLGFVAWSMANRDLEEMALGLMNRSGRDLTRAGRVCGMVATGLLIVQGLLIAVFGSMSYLSR